MSALDTLLTTQIFSFLLIFSRTGAMFMTLPGFSDATVSPQIRLMFALAFVLVLTPVLSPMLPAPPASVYNLAILIICEMLIGIFIGGLLQIIMSAAAFAGFMISTSMSMSNAFIFSPTMSTSNTVMGTFLMLVAMTLFFALDLHHLVFLGMIDSYQIFVPGSTLYMGDMAQQMAELIGKSLLLGLKMSAPFLIIIIGILFAMGLLARMVPQIQVFILSVPVQVLVGAITLMAVLAAMGMYLMSEVDDYLKNFLAG